MNHNSFDSIGDFALALDRYKGNNIWEDVIWCAVIPGDEIDAERCQQEGDGNVVFFKKDKGKLVYSESEEEWFTESDKDED